ncbi:hypothetical protein ACTUVJ_002133 [Stenotrophomonas indicatrix]
MEVIFENRENPTGISMIERWIASRRHKPDFDQTIQYPLPDPLAMQIIAKQEALPAYRRRPEGAIHAFERPIRCEHRQSVRPYRCTYIEVQLLSPLARCRPEVM